MLKVGLTGGIGAGKTTVAKIFHQMGVPIFHADVEAKKIMCSMPKIIAEIKELLGEESYEGTKLNKKFIANKIFKDNSLRLKINDIVHPHVSQNYVNWLASIETKYCLKEAAILIETNAHKDLDKIICVTAPEDIRIQRVLLKRKGSEELIRNIIKNQISEEERIALADYVIQNDDLESLIPQVAKIHKELNT